VLILGTFPSPKSREQGFYYGHPQNLFWKALAASLGVAVPTADAVPSATLAGPGSAAHDAGARQPLAASPDEPPIIAARRAFLHAHHVALWDVIRECDIVSAADASIRNPVPNRFRPLIERSDIGRVYTTGRKATDLYNRLGCEEECGLPTTYLPSTSPANRAAQAKPAFREVWAGIGRVLQAAARVD
jgi:hypoxanthine-DNA glycosylase